MFVRQGFEVDDGLEERVGRRLEIFAPNRRHRLPRPKTPAVAKVHRVHVRKGSGRLAPKGLHRGGLPSGLSPKGPLPVVPTALSVSGLIDYAKCPKLFYWSSVRPLPRKPNPRARLGSEVHRWIENQSRGQASLLDLDELPDLATEQRLGELPSATDLQNAFKRSRFNHVVPINAERPFILWIDGVVVRGRIDAIYERDGRGMGGRRLQDRPHAVRRRPDHQLAARRLRPGMHRDLGRKPEELTLTYLYLGEGDAGKEVQSSGDDPDTLRARIKVLLKVLLKGIGVGKYEATPGRQCHWCDFQAFCPEGKKYVKEKPRVE